MPDNKYETLGDWSLQRMKGHHIVHSGNISMYFIRTDDPTYGPKKAAAVRPEVSITDRTPAEALSACAMENSEAHLALCDFRLGHAETQAAPQEEKTSKQDRWSRLQDKVFVSQEEEPEHGCELLEKRRLEYEQTRMNTVEMYICHSNQGHGASSWGIGAFSVADFVQHKYREYDKEKTPEQIQPLDIIEMALLNVGRTPFDIMELLATPFAAENGRPKEMGCPSMFFLPQHIFYIAEEKQADILIIGGFDGSLWRNMPEEIAQQYLGTIFSEKPNLQKIVFALGGMSPDAQQELGRCLRKGLADRQKDYGAVQAEELRQDKT